MKLSPKQRVIISELKELQTINLSDAVRLIGKDIYCNAEKHVGAVMSNMVRRGLIKRVKKGVFKLAPMEGQQTFFQPPNSGIDRTPEPRG
jgi:hypothetical protein